MFRGNYTTQRIVLLGAIGVMCAMTFTVIGAIASVIVLIFMVDQVVFGGSGGKWLYRKVVLRKPFVVYGEPQTDVLEQSITLPISQNKQCFNITLRMGVELWVLFISIRIVGQGIHPEISKLYNWEWGIDRELIDIYPPYYVPAQDRWYWQYRSRYLRQKNSRITIGVECLAESKFKGNVEMDITTEETSGNVSLPLIVEENEKTN